MQQTYPFPYFGAGDASYFEMAEISISFTRKPSDKEFESIKEACPAPLEVFNLVDELLFVSSSTSLHCHIAETYELEDGKDPKNEENWSEGRSFFASASQVNAFNHDVEKWLCKVHQILPIFFALRAEDEEADGTKFSSWHEWSLTQISSILPFFDDIVEKCDYEGPKALDLTEILLMQEEVSSLDEKYKAYLYPGETEFDAFMKGDIEPLKKISNSSYADQTILYFLDNLGPQNIERLILFADVFLDFEKKISEKTFEILNMQLFKYLDINHPSFEKIAQRIKCPSFVERLIYTIYHKLLSHRKYEEYIEVCKKLLKIPIDPKVESGFYSNILWVLQKDNTGLPVDKKLNELALVKSLPKGIEYPAIFFNACCLYVEMEEFDDAYKMVELALTHHFDRGTMLDQVTRGDMFKDFREKTKVLKLLENKDACEEIKPRLISPAYAYTQFKIHEIYNNGHATNFSQIILIDKTLEAEEDLQLFNKNENLKEKTLVVVNGDLRAKSVVLEDEVYLLVMGKIYCSEALPENVIEKQHTDFSYVAQTSFT